MVRQTAIEFQRVLCERQQTVFLRGHGHAVSCVGVYHTIDFGTCMVNGGVNHKTSAVHIFALVKFAHNIAIVVDFDQIRRLHVVEQHAIAVNQKMVRLIRYAHADVGINQIGHAKMGD